MVIRLAPAFSKPLPKSIKSSALLQPSRVLTETGKEVFLATASTKANAWLWHLRKATPCSDLTTFFDGQPILISMPLKPAAWQYLAAVINVWGFLPKI